MGADAERYHQVWRELIADEALYEAVLAGRHQAIADERDLSATDCAVLDELATNRDALRWNVENLRFRGSFDTMLKLRRWMPLTTSLLTDGRSDWLLDLVHEYLALHRWNELGHRHFAECRRFAAFTTRVRQRRRLPEHFDVVLHYETAICALMEATVDEVPADTLGPGGGLGIADGRPRPGPFTRLIELTVDIRAWIAAGEPLDGCVPAEPVTLLAFVPVHADMYWVSDLDDTQRTVFDACDGHRTSAEIARDLAANDDEREQIGALLAAWVEATALVLV